MVRDKIQNLNSRAVNFPSSDVYSKIKDWHGTNECTHARRRARIHTHTHTQTHTHTHDACTKNRTVFMTHTVFDFFPSRTGGLVSWYLDFNVLSAA